MPVFLWGLWIYRETSVAGRHAVAAHRENEIPWTPFSGDDMVKLRKQGKPMIIDFTADWCWNCKINEATALNTQPVVQFIRDQKFVPFLADYTDESDDIRKWLNVFGTDAVPLTVIIPPGKGKVITLNGVYTQSQLLAKLKAAIEQSDPGSAGAMSESETAPPASPEKLDGHVGMSP